MTDQGPQLTLVSGSDIALALAVNALTGAQFSSGIAIRARLEDTAEVYASFKLLAEEAYRYAYALASNNGLVVCIRQDYIWQPRTLRKGYLFSVGYVIACCRDRPLGIATSPGWLPQAHYQKFANDAGLIHRRLEKRSAAPPDANNSALVRRITEHLQQNLGFPALNGPVTVH